MNGALKMWRAMYLKELWQNAGWAAGGAVVLGLVMRYIVSSNATENFVNFNQLWRQLNLSLMFGSLVLSIALAFLQILPETSRDRWAFLIHRPATASTLFYAKVAAGLTLYLLATVTPFLSTVLWIRTPGNVAAPFDWGLTESGFAWIASGVPSFLAGFLTAVRPVRWYGTRVFPILALLPVMLSLGNARTLVGSIGWSLLMVLFLWPASRAVFLERAGERRPILGARFALGTTLTVGSTVLSIIIFAALLGIYRSVAPAKSEWVATYQYALTNDGRLIKFQSSEDGVTTVRSIADGSILYEGKSGNEWLTHNRWTAIDAQLASIGPYDYSSIGAPERYVSQIGDRGAGRRKVWYSYDGLLISYDVRSRKIVAAVGELGYRTCHSMLEARLTRPFPRDASLGNPQSLSKTFIQDGDTIYEIDGSLYDLSEGMSTVRVAVKSPKIASGQLISTDNFLGPIIIRYPHQFEVYAGEGHGYRLKFSGKVESFPDSYDTILYGVTDHYFVLRYPGRKDSVYVEYDDRDRVAKRYMTVDSPETVGMGSPVVYGMLVPIGIDVAWNFAITGNHLAHIWRDTARIVNWPMLAGNLVADALSVLIIFAISRRCAFSRLRMTWWLIAGALLGFWAVVALLCLDGWPARERCRNCGKMRVVTRETCEHCAAAWPDRSVDGTEIFEIEEPMSNVRVSV